MKGILGQKVGMTQVFSDQGLVIPVTIINIEPNVVTKVLTSEKDGYTALQLAVFDKKKSRQKKPEIGHFKKAQTEPKHFVKEIRNMQGYELGQKVDATIFTSGELVDISATSKGKGFSGAIKRHNQSIGPKSHGGGGGSKPVRLTGSIGDISGNKVVKGMTMPGQLGNKKATVQNLEVVLVDKANNFLLVRGSIPGAKKSFVTITQAVKQLPANDKVKLVDLIVAARKNHLIELGKKYQLDFDTNMDVEEIQRLFDEAEAKAKAEEEKAHETKTGEKE